MSVRLRDERTYDAPARTLFELWIDPAFQEARSRYAGATGERCTVTREGSIVLVEMIESRHTGFRDVVFRTRQQQRWDPEAMRARWELTKIEGPGDARAAGTLVIEALSETRSRLVLDGELTINVRFLGRMIEEVAGRGFTAARAKEAPFIAEQLAKR
jgi:hypothetical protein